MSKKLESMMGYIWMWGNKTFVSPIKEINKLNKKLRNLQDRNPNKKTTKELWISEIELTLFYIKIRYGELKEPR